MKLRLGIKLCATMQFPALAFKKLGMRTILCGCNLSGWGTLGWRWVAMPSIVHLGTSSEHSSVGMHLMNIYGHTPAPYHWRYWQVTAVSSIFVRACELQPDFLKGKIMSARGHLCGVKWRFYKDFNFFNGLLLVIIFGIYSTFMKNKFHHSDKESCTHSPYPDINF